MTAPIAIVPPERPELAPQRRRILTHGYFELRLEEECHRALRYHSGFGLLHLAGGPGGDEERMVEIISSSVRLTDVVAVYGPGEFEVLLCDTPPDQLRTVVARLSRNLAGTPARIGVAAHGVDGRTADELLARARGAALGSPEQGVRLPEAEVGPMHDLAKLLQQVAPSDLSVLIFGETGAGKERVAEQVHYKSLRAPHPFLCLNCAALTESLLESELFGHARGAFTGAVQAKAGLFESAGGGTVFLDEVGELPLAVQVKLLRVLEERKVRRVGDLKSVPVDVRFVAATNRDLEEEVAAGRFRQDLYFRLNGVTLLVPPLRERRSEIEGLSRTFVADASLRLKRAAPELSAEALGLLETYAWPGNVRELRNVMERAVLIAPGGVILPQHLPEAKMTTAFAPRRSFPAPAQRPAPHAVPAQPEGLPAPANLLELDHEQLQAHVTAHERRRILEALARCAGNQTEAARALGLSRRTLITRLETFGIPRPRKK